jgi:hypothetical protein
MLSEEVDSWRKVDKRLGVEPHVRVGAEECSLGVLGRVECQNDRDDEPKGCLYLHKRLGTLAITCQTDKVV